MRLSTLSTSEADSPTVSSPQLHNANPSTSTAFRQLREVTKKKTKGLATQYIIPIFESSTRLQNPESEKGLATLRHHLRCVSDFSPLKSEILASFADQLRGLAASSPSPRC